MWRRTAERNTSSLYHIPAMLEDFGQLRGLKFSYDYQAILSTFSLTHGSGVNRACPSEPNPLRTHSGRSAGVGKVCCKGSALVGSREQLPATSGSPAANFANGTYH